MPIAGFDLQGHRGARGLLPENSLPGFRKALELGVTTLEMDVVVAADSTVVVSHEPWMSATTCSHPSGAPVSEAEERDLRIFGMDYDEVERFDCGRRGHPGFPEQQPREVGKPRLIDVLRMAESERLRTGRSAPWYSIETKSRPEWDGQLTPPPPEFVRLVHDVLVAEGVLERSILQSFDPRTLREARKLVPTWILALLVAHEDDPGVDTNLDALGFIPDIYSPDRALLTEGLVRVATGHGMLVIPWTVNEPAEMRALVALGVHGLITDYPDRGRAVLDELGLLTDR